MSTFPASLDNLSTSHADGTAEVIHASTINDLASAVNAMESATQAMADGASVNVTGANLSELTGGSVSSLHSHATVQVATVTLLSGPILALHITPVTVVPAPGPNRTIVPVSWAVRLHHGAFDYAFQPGFGFVRIQYDPDSNSLGTLDGDANAITSSADRVYYNGVSGQLIFPANEAIAISATQQLISGDGTIDVTVAYYVV